MRTAKGPGGLQFDQDGEVSRPPIDERIYEAMLRYLDEAPLAGWHRAEELVDTDNPRFDALRHMLATSETVEELQHDRGYPAPLAMLAANLFGLGHEVKNFHGVRSAAEDLFNNFVGSIPAAVMDDPEKIEEMVKMLSYFTPDGKDESDDDYDQGGRVKDDDPPFDMNSLMAGIMRVESSDGVNMMNPTSTATGKYGQLFSEIEDLAELDGITREQFAEELGLQDQIFGMRAEGLIPGIPGLIDSAFDLTEEYSPQLNSFDYRPAEVAALVNYLGRQGTREYFASLRDGTDYEVPGTNKTPEEYLEEYNVGVAAHREREGAQQPTRTVDTDFKPIKNNKGGRVVKYNDGGKGPGDPPKNFGVADNLLQVLGTYGKTREEAEQDPNYEDRLDLTKEEVFDNFMDRYGPNLTSELRKPQNPNSPFYNPDRNPRRGGLEELEEQMDKVRVIKEDPARDGKGAYFNTQTDEVYFGPEVSRSSVDRGSVSGEEFTHSIQDPFREGRGKYGNRRPFDAAIQGLLDSSRETEVDYRTGKQFKLLPDTGVLAPDLGLDDSSYSDLAESLYYGGNTDNPISGRNAEHELEAMMNTGLLKGIKTGVIPEGTITQDDLSGIVDRYNQGVANRPNVQMANENFQNSPVMTRDLHPKKEKFWKYDESGKPSMTKKGKKYYKDKPYQLRNDLGMEDYVSRETFQTNPRHVRNLVALINKDVAGHDPMGREEMRNLMNYLNQEGYVRPNVEHGDNFLETGNKRYVNDRRNARRAGYAPRGGRDNPYLND